MSPKYTIATLYRGDLCETYVALFEGDLTAEDEFRMAEQMDLEREDDGALDWIGFCGVDVQDKDAEELIFMSSTQGDMRVYDGVVPEERSSIYRGIE